MENVSEKGVGNEEQLSSYYYLPREMWCSNVNEVNRPVVEWEIDKI